MDPLDKREQKLSTSRNPDGSYSGEHEGYEFTVAKSHGWWSGEIENVEGPESKTEPMETKREVVNKIKEMIERF